MERHWDAASRGENAAPASDGSVVSRQSFCDYLVSARKQRGLSINDIATVTRIPVRSLERLESGLFEELPADVFVRGFLRSYARCVGLNAEETIRRYTHCGMAPAPVSSVMAGDAASELMNVPAAAADDVRQVTSKSQRSSRTTDEQLANEMPSQQAALAAPEPVARTERRTGPVAEQRLEGDDSSAAGEVSEPRRKRKRRKRKQRRDAFAASGQPSGEASSESSRESSGEASSGALGQQPVRHLATASESGQALAAESPVQIAAATDSAAVGSPRSQLQRASSDAEAAVSASAAVAAPASAQSLAGHGPGTGSGLEPAQPSGARVQVRSPSAPPLPPRRVRASTVTARPVLSIDDDHPEEAERSQEERVERSDASWRSFLPPSLLDSDDGSHRGTLTLAVIILVIVATLTMSYLLRRPNVSGDGVTWQAPVPGEMSSSRGHG